MATLAELKQKLKQEASAVPLSSTRDLTDVEYSNAFNIFLEDSAWTNYRDFILPQLSNVISEHSQNYLSILEIGPGPKSVLAYLRPESRRRIASYTAYEPNALFHAKLTASLDTPENPPLPRLTGDPTILKARFSQKGKTKAAKPGSNTYDIILFCHSMYGMKPKRAFIEAALEKLAPEGKIVVFHRDDGLKFEGLVCHKTGSWPTGTMLIPDKDEVLDIFAPFIAGFEMRGGATDAIVKTRWREACRSLGRKQHGRLLFSVPEVVKVFNGHAGKLGELTSKVPTVPPDFKIKNSTARSCHPAAIVRPANVEDVQTCIRWAVKNKTSLTVVGGTHSGQCVVSNVVAVDMSAFNQTSVIKNEDASTAAGTVVVGTGCTTGDIIRETCKAGLTVPLGARPSVGAGLWLHGGIGHLSRMHGLTCDSIIGAVLVSTSGEIFCVGDVPEEHRPPGAVRPKNEPDLLWAIKGAGTNFGIVLSVTFRAYKASRHLVKNWVVPLVDGQEAIEKLQAFDIQARRLSGHSSADAYLYSETDQLRLGVTLFNVVTADGLTSAPRLKLDFLKGDGEPKIVDPAGLFHAEMYVSKMHGGHGRGKTSSFKRCVFVTNLQDKEVVKRLVAALKTRPGPQCYIHLLHGGEAVNEVSPTATAFGCRDWTFACVITGVWPRERDGSETARKTIQWVYDVTADLLASKGGVVGVYGADLGPDPRDVILAKKAFVPNLPQLARLKKTSDPGNVLIYTCPLPVILVAPRLIILVTGESCVGKDYCADLWSGFFQDKGLSARVACISDATKEEYARASGADYGGLRQDRTYKERHRSALTNFYHGQKEARPQLPGEYFLNVFKGHADVDVLLITGMRDEAPVATFCSLVPSSRVVEVRIQTSDDMRRSFGGTNPHDGGNSRGSRKDYRPDIVFRNHKAGSTEARTFAEQRLLCFVDPDLQRLADMVRSLPNHPRPGIQFRHVLNIAQQPGGLQLCTSLLQSQYTGVWNRVDAIVSCEAGGFVFASTLALQVGRPLKLIRKAGKLPQPTISVTKASSYISELEHNKSADEVDGFEIEEGSITPGSSVVVVDDVLSTGETLCAVLQLLGQAGIGPDIVSVMAVAELPVHRGRALLKERGYGRARVQSLLVFDGK